MRNYVGLASSFHDPALAIVDERGEVRFAEAAERYLQNKRAFNAPPDDINRIEHLVDHWATQGADLVVSRTWSTAMARRVALVRSAARVVSRVRRGSVRERDDDCGALKAEHAAFLLDAVNASLGLAASNLKLKMRIDAVLGGRSSRPARAADTSAPRGHGAGADGRGSRAAPAQACRGARGARRVVTIDFDHHLTHAAAACYMSPFQDAVCAVIDGYGERGSTAFFRYRDGIIEPIDAPPSRGRASLGRFYGAITYACGFDVIKGEEWKVMGLAPYGSPNPRVQAIVGGMLRVDGLHLVRGPERRPHHLLLPELSRFDPADVAHAGQREYERLAARLLTNLHALGVSDNLILAGGCALNSTFNGKILEKTPFERLFVPPAPGDDGCCLGAAWLAFRRDHPRAPVPAGVGSPYLGTSMDPLTLERWMTLGKTPAMRLSRERMVERVADLVARGKTVGWVQGRAEFGPRALGNRSILADPRRPDIKDELNRRVKFREGFRPFAPSILHEYGDAYFEGYQESPYMERTLRFKAAVRDEVPGVVHVNGTGRLQTVKREWNPLFHDLLEAFRKRTGIPILLNTSLNIMGKPIVHTVEDALGMFYTTGLDALAVEDILLLKP